MLDWRALAFNSLWVFAAALALAAFSHASWAASLRETGLRQVLGKRSYQLVFNLAGLSFCIGLAGTAQETWRWAAWLVLAALFLLQLGLGLRKVNHS